MALANWWNDFGFWILIWQFKGGDFSRIENRKSRIENHLSERRKEKTLEITGFHAHGRPLPHLICPIDEHRKHPKLGGWFGLTPRRLKGLCPIECPKTKKIIKKAGKTGIRGIHGACPFRFGFIEKHRFDVCGDLSGCSDLHGARRLDSFLVNTLNLDSAYLPIYSLDVI